MSPLSWVILMILFITVYIIFITTNFFILSYSPLSLEMKKSLIK